MKELDDPVGEAETVMVELTLAVGVGVTGSADRLVATLLVAEVVPLTVCVGEIVTVMVNMTPPGAWLLDGEVSAGTLVLFTAWSGETLSVKLGVIPMGKVVLFPVWSGGTVTVTVTVELTPAVSVVVTGSAVRLMVMALPVADAVSLPVGVGKTVTVTVELMPAGNPVDSDVSTGKIVKLEAAVAIGKMVELVPPVGCRKRSVNIVQHLQGCNWGEGKSQAHPSM